MQLGKLEPLWIGQLAAGCEHRLSEIDLRGNRPPWSAASFAGEFLNAHSIVFGCRFRGEIIGFGVVHHVQTDAHLLNFAVAQEFRGLNVGKRLMVSIIDSLRSLGCEVLTLEVRRSNVIAQALYESFGFEVVGERLRYYPDDGEDALVMKASPIATSERLSSTHDLETISPQLHSTKSPNDHDADGGLFL